MKNKKTRWIIRLSIVLVVIVIFVLAGSMAWEYHEQPRFCATCHVMQSYLDGWTGDVLDENGSVLLSAQHQSVDIACLDCHPANIKQQVNELITYVKGDFNEPLKRRKFDDAFCTTCHDDEAERIAATSDYEATWHLDPLFEGRVQTAIDQSWTNVNSMTINPHAIGLDITNTSDPHHEGAPALACNNCHLAHRESPQIDYCYTCHHTASLIPCSVCHTE